MAETIRILGMAGSLRKGSYNRSTLRASVDLVPPGTVIETCELHDIPAFNADQEREPPQPVRDFKARIRAADAILMITPEYNYSFSGVLKNAIDWASRPYGDSAWYGKPVAIMGASGGTLGTARAQYHLRQVFVFLNMFALNQPEVMIANAEEKFDEEGRLNDQKTIDRIQELLRALVDWTRMLQKARTS